jgi:uncharacterized protein (DUF2236 family)
MMTTIIVVASLAFGVALTLAWLLKPQLRAQIEAPKHFFQDRVQQYDRTLEDARGASGGSADETQ